MKAKPPEFKTLEEIAEFDFFQYALDKYGLAWSLKNKDGTDDETAKAIVQTEAENEKFNAVKSFLLVKENALKLYSDIKILVEKYLEVASHKDALILRGKVLEDASEELIKKEVRAQFFVLQFILNPAMDKKAEWDNGTRLLDEVTAEIAKVKTENFFLSAIDITLAEPDWVSRQIKTLEEADACFKRLIPGGKFPTPEQLEDAQKLVKDPNWNKQLSTKAMLESALIVMNERMEEKPA